MAMVALGLGLVVFSCQQIRQGRSFRKPYNSRFGAKRVLPAPVE